jgi:hypothetical protein
MGSAARAEESFRGSLDSFQANAVLVESLSYPTALSSLAVGSRADIGVEKEDKSGRAPCCVLLEGSSVAGRRHAYLPPEVEPKGRTRAETAILRDALYWVLRGLQPALGDQNPLVEHPP